LKTAAENDTDDSIFLGKGTYSGASFVYSGDNSNSLSIKAEEGLSAEQVVFEESTININSSSITLTNKSEISFDNVTLISSSIKISAYKTVIKNCHLIRSWLNNVGAITTIDFMNNTFTCQSEKGGLHTFLGFECVKIHNNIFHGCSGLIFRVFGKNFILNNNLFYNNDGHYNELSFKLYLGNTISDNVMVNTSDTSVFILNNTISHYNYKKVTNLIFSNNKVSKFITKNNIIHSDDSSQNNDENLLNKTHFIDPVNGDFHLKPTSSYIDAGSNENIAYTETDLDGNPRIANGIVDMGAYEFTTNRTHPADTNQNWVIESDEFSAYNNAWKNAENWPVEPAVIPSEYLTRCGFLLKKGGRYKDVGLNRPLCWMPDN